MSKKKAHVVSIRLPDAHCPKCNTILSGATGFELSDDGTEPECPLPEEGFVTFCDRCGAACKFTSTLHLVFATRKEVHEAVEKDVDFAIICSMLSEAGKRNGWSLDGYLPTILVPEDQLVHVRWGLADGSEHGAEYGVAKFVHGKWWDYTSSNPHAQGRQCAEPTAWHPSNIYGRST